MINYITIQGGAKKYYLAKKPDGSVKDGINVIFYTKENNVWVESYRSYIPESNMTLDEHSIKAQLIVLEAI